MDGWGVLTYSQVRLAFSYMYIKRQLEDDGIHTRPLNVVLNPVPLSYFCLQTEAEELSPDDKFHFQVFGHCFTTIRQAYVFMSVIHDSTQSGNQELENQISITTCPRQLLGLSRKYRHSSKWCAVKYLMLQQIVDARMQQLDNAFEMLAQSCDRKIVNACEQDGWIGVKYNAKSSGLATFKEHFLHFFIKYDWWTMCNLPFHSREELCPIFMGVKFILYAV